MSEVRTPFECFRDTDGTPLDGGYVYVGVENQEPITHPASVFWDADLTIVAAQPIRTLGGYPVRAGAPAKVYTSGGYSICVKNKNGEIVVSAVSSGSLEALLADATSASRGAGMIGYGSGVTYPAGTIGNALASIPSAYVTYAADQAQTYRAFTASGTAPAFTLTPSPALTAYVAGQRFRWKFHAAGTTGSNTGNISGLGAKSFKQYDSTGALVDGVIKSGMLADVEYDGTYLVILDSLPTKAGGGYKKLRATCTGASATIIFMADWVTVRDASGNATELSGLSLTLDTSTVGAGGMQASISANTLYDWGVIYNQSAAKLFAWPTGTTPTLPTGYTQWFVCGSFRSNAASYPKGAVWKDEMCSYVANKSTPVDRPILASGTVGTWNAHAEVSLADYVPARAKEVLLTVGNRYCGSALSSVLVNPNGNYYSFEDAGGVLSHVYLNNDTAETLMCSMILESQNIYVMSSGAGGWVGLNGYVDSL